MQTIEEGEFERMVNFLKLYEAHLNAERGKRSRQDVALYKYALEDNLLNTRDELLAGTYEVGEYHRFFVHEPKKRLVMSLRYRDRVVQWAIYQRLMPFYDKMFINDSYACRIGKGSHAASNRLQYWLRQVHRKPGKWYYLKLDISKYFYRVDHEVLIRILRRRIRDEKLMRLLEKIINGREPFGLPPGRSPEDVPPEEWLNTVGMPIGNLTSQLFANIYLNELDQYCKHVLRIHYFVRYQDDTIILSNSKKQLREWKEQIRIFLKEELHLDLNNKTAIRPVDGGIDFVGFRTWGDHKRIKKSTAKRMKRGVKHLTIQLAKGEISRAKFERCMASYSGLIQQAHAEHFKNKLNKIYLETMREMKQNRFECMHEALEHCRRSLEPCTKECRWYGTCGECKSYFIPISQEPCSGCVNVDKLINHREGEIRK